MAQESNKSIDNDLDYQILKDMLEVAEIRIGFDSEPFTPIDTTTIMNEKDEQKPKESLIKEIDENKDIPPMPDEWPWDYLRWKDYCKMNNISNKDVVEIQDNGYVIKDGFGREIKRIPPTDPKVETGYITRDEENGIGYLHYQDGSIRAFKIMDATGKKKQKESAINELKDLANEYGKEDPMINKDKLNESEKLDVEKILSALDKIASKLLSYKYPDAHNILNLKEFITSDHSMIKGTHLDKEYINQVIYRIDRLINDAEDDLDASELMVLYFGIYLARIKNKEIRQVKISRRI